MIGNRFTKRLNSNPVGGLYGIVTLMCDGFITIIARVEMTVEDLFLLTYYNPNLSYYLLYKQVSRITSFQGQL